MRRWFLSYNSQDAPLMERLDEALRRKDPDGKTFFAPKSLRAGGYWLPQLAEAIAEATIFVLLVGENGLGSWQVDEYYEARDRRVRIVLVLLKEKVAPGLPFLRQLHWIVTPDPASEQSIAQLLHAADGEGTRPGELWRYTAPYRGLSAMTESDSDYFFGRQNKTVEAVQAVATTPDRLTILLGNSGVGKSSLAQAGVLAALSRQGWPENTEAAELWPHSLRESRRWCFLKFSPGAEPVRALVEPFIRTWRLDAVDPKRAELLSGWTDRLRTGVVTIRDLLDATQARYFDELKQSAPPAFLIYVDQGEELYVRSEESQAHCFSKIIAQGLVDPRLRVIMSMRADFFGELQKDEPIYDVHRLVSVPPLREGELSDVVNRPALLLGARFETEKMAGDIARRAAEDSAKDAGALPLLSYLLDDMWTKMIERGDGTLRLPPHAIELGGVLADRADAFLAQHPNAEQQLRRILTLKLATVTDGMVTTRRRAFRSEFSEEEWRLIHELAAHPNRLLITATPEGSESYSEVAHEAIFERWSKLRDWIGGEREFLIWKSGLENARRTWQAAPDDAQGDALLNGLALRNAQSWTAQRPQDIPKADMDFVGLSARAERRRQLRTQASFGVLVLVIFAGIGGWLIQTWLREGWHQFSVVRPWVATQVAPYVLRAEKERGLKTKESFQECADCPEMIVIPPGGFGMGSSENEDGHLENEGKRPHKVVIERRFAVSKYNITLKEWDACVAYGDCDQLSDSGWTGGNQPVVNLNWNQAQTYAKWLSRITTHQYRLLSEAEWEYAARAGTSTAYWWGNEVGGNMADCNGCKSSWDKMQPSPVGSFAANPFGLYDMHGEVVQWVDDCYHSNYDGAPTDGLPWTSGDCSSHVTRGGSCFSIPSNIRSAKRQGHVTVYSGNDIGFRVARTLAAQP